MVLLLFYEIDDMAENVVVVSVDRWCGGCSLPLGCGGPAENQLSHPGSGRL